MSNLAGWKMAAAALVVGGSTYFALEWLKPYHHPEVKLEGLVPAAQVFGDAPATETASEPATPAASPAAETPAPATPEMPAQEEPAQVAAVETPAAEPTPPPAPAPVAQPEPAPVAEPTPSKPAVKAEPPKAAPVASEKPPVKKQLAKSKPAPSKPVEAPVVASAWWQGDSASGFSVVYAGSAAFRRALVVMGSAPFASADSANASIKITDANGKPVSGHWELNNVNPSMLIFPLSQVGTYQVQIGATLSDRQSRSLGKSYRGPIQVR